jgi:hypothetical protein
VRPKPWSSSSVVSRREGFPPRDPNRHACPAAHPVLRRGRRCPSRIRDSGGHRHALPRAASRPRFFLLPLSRAPETSRPVGRPPLSAGRTSPQTSGRAPSAVCGSLGTAPSRCPGPWWLSRYTWMCPAGAGEPPGTSCRAGLRSRPDARRGSDPQGSTSRHLASSLQIRRAPNRELTAPPESPVPGGAAASYPRQLPTAPAAH